MIPAHRSSPVRVRVAADRGHNGQTAGTAAGRRWDLTEKMAMSEKDQIWNYLKQHDG